MEEEGIAMYLADSNTSKSINKKYPKAQCKTTLKMNKYMNTKWQRTNSWVKTKDRDSSITTRIERSHKVQALNFLKHIMSTRRISKQIKLLNVIIIILIPTLSWWAASANKKTDHWITHDFLVQLVMAQEYTNIGLFHMWLILTKKMMMEPRTKVICSCAPKT